MDVGGRSGSAEVEILPISALNHFGYCPRSAGLILVDGVFADNIYTAEGVLGHERVDRGGVKIRGARRSKYDVEIYSDRLGLIGRADAVEWLAGDPHPRPVEFKRAGGGLAPGTDLQLAAQGICLEEMLKTTVTHLVMYSTTTHVRTTLPLDADLRQRVEEAVAALRGMLSTEAVPPPTEERSRCRGCSLRYSCLPDLSRDSR